MSGYLTWVDYTGLGINAALLGAAWYAARAGVRSFKAASEANNAARDANEQSRRDSIEQSRPYVFVEFVPGLWGAGSFDLRITNTGLTAARNLTMQFSDWPTDQEGSVIISSTRKMFDTARVLPPRSSLRAIWHSVPDGEVVSGEKGTGMPGKGTITVRYENTDPAVTDRYVDAYPVMIYDAGEWPVPEDGISPSAELTREAKYLGDILKAVARHLGSLRW